jgi:hypothetical protein
MSVIKLKVSRIGDETPKGNVIVTLRGEEEVVKTQFGDKIHKPCYLIAVKAGTVSVELDQEIEVDLDEWNVSTHDGSLTPWLHLK